MVWSPVARSRLISSSLVVVSTGSRIFWSPSRGPTSTIRTDGGADDIVFDSSILSMCYFARILAVDIVVGNPFPGPPFVPGSLRLPYPGPTLRGPLMYAL